MSKSMFEKAALEIIGILKDMAAKLSDLDKKHAKALDEQKEESFKKAA